MNIDATKNRLMCLGMWSWITIIEKEKDKLSANGRVALRLLHDDLEKLQIIGNSDEANNT